MHGRCSHCEDVVATVNCDQCEDYFCDEDFASLHKRGKGATHTNTQLDVCVECDYQVATRECKNCEDMFCDTCLKYAGCACRLGGGGQFAHMCVCSVCQVHS